jgi:phosphoglycolate phosphatase-like HAD superfamily hydrolase
MAGTTVQDKYEVELCFTKAARETNLNITEEEILAVQGWGKRHVFEVFWERQTGGRNALWQQKVEDAYTLFRNIPEDHYISAPVHPTEGGLELFAFLKEHYIPVALTTGFYRKVTNIILGKPGWLQGLDNQYTGNENMIIQASVTSDEVEHGRPEPDMIFKSMQLPGVRDTVSVINIGDTPSDIHPVKTPPAGFPAV